jgi:tetratricopeptide (TPR) repeat protein
MVTIEKEGYEAKGQQNLTVHYDLPNVLNFQLRAGDRGRLDFEVPAEERAQKQQEAKQRLAAQRALIAATKLMKESSQLEASGQTTEAMVKLEEAVAVKPDAVQAWVRLGQLRFQLKLYNPAVEAIQKAISFQSDNPSLYEQLAEVYSAQGQSQKSKEQYAQRHFVSAKALINQNKNKEAVAKLQKTLEVAPKHAEAHYELGVLLISLSRIDDGLNHLKTYRKLSPRGPNIETAQALLQQLGK